MPLQVESAAWNDKGDILTAIADGRLITWYYPNAVAIDRDLLVLASTSRDAAEFGKVMFLFFFPFWPTSGCICTPRTITKNG